MPNLPASPVRVTVGRKPLHLHLHLQPQLQLAPAYHIDPKPNPGTNGGINQSLPSSGPGLGSASFLRLVSRCSRQPDGVRDFSLYGYKRLGCLVV